MLSPSPKQVLTACIPCKRSCMSSIQIGCPIHTVLCHIWAKSLVNKLYLHSFSNLYSLEKSWNKIFLLSWLRVQIIHLYSLFMSERGMNIILPSCQTILYYIPKKQRGFTHPLAKWALICLAYKMCVTFESKKKQRIKKNGRPYTSF